jgi:acyl dehydratase
MATQGKNIALLPLDTSDVDRWIGRPVGGPELKEPLYANDIRRFVHAQHNPNRLHYDEDFAAGSHFGRLLAPQSFTVVACTAHGALPAVQGRIDGSHMLFGGDEWWFYGPRIYPGDFVKPHRVSFDYRVVDTSFAGPTVLQRGDTTYINQRGEVIAKQRSTAVRYLVENVVRIKSFSGQEAAPTWSDEELDALDRDQSAYHATFAEHVLKTARDVEIHEELPTRKIGPHTVTSFATEYIALLGPTWGAKRQQPGPNSAYEAGWIAEMSHDKAKRTDGLSGGPSRGHVQTRYANLVGMPRGYGYGASMGVWVLDYVANWAGELAAITHSRVQYRSPPLTGELAILNGTVADIADDSGDPAGRIVVLEIEMKTNAGTLMAKGPVRVRMPPA